MLGTLDIQEAAEKAASNWQRFDSFAWFRDREISDSQNWAIVYTSNRDSGLLAQSNASIINKALQPFADGDDPDVVFESHSHWAVGHVDGFSLRVFDANGEITEAFQKYHELAQAMDDYPYLDESDHSERELEATLANIGDASWSLKKRFNLPEGWEGEVYSWLSDHHSGEIENVDDQGGYPSEEALRDAFAALGFEPTE